jgi:hypothetical protein
MLDIQWHVQVPKEMRATIEPIIERYRWLIPQWVYQFKVSFYSTKTDEKGVPDNALACIYVNDEYRSATLEVFADWLDGNEKTRRYNIIHELCHLYTCLPGNFFNRFLDNLYPESERLVAYNLARDEYRRLAEQATQDLAWSLLNLEDSISQE